MQELELKTLKAPTEVQLAATIKDIVSDSGWYRTHAKKVPNLRLSVGVLSIFSPIDDFEMYLLFCLIEIL